MAPRAFIACLLACCGAAGLRLPLHTQGRFIVDADGDRVKLACTNWYGSHLKTFVQNGLHKRGADAISADIAALGFNCVRLSYSVEAYVRNPPVRSVYISQLENTTGRRFLDVFDEVVAALTSQGLMVIVNNHNSDAGWCCSLDDDNGLWYNDAFPESTWIESLQGMAQRYQSNALVIGYDLRNEVRVNLKMRRTVVWGDVTAIHPLFQPALMDWKGAVERGGAAVLSVDPHALIIVEVLIGFFLCPFHLDLFPLQSMQGHVVWSAHEYDWFNDAIGWAWAVCDSGTRYYHYSAVPRFIYEQLPFLGHPAYLLILLLLLVGMALLGRCTCRCKRFSECIFTAAVVGLFSTLSFALLLRSVHISSRPINDYASYAMSRDAAWGHIAMNNIGPLWVGEFGSGQRSETWNWTMSYLRERDFDFAYWSIDGEHYPRSASEFGEHVPGFDHEETFGLFQEDYRTVRHGWKLQDIQALMPATISSANVISKSPPIIGAKEDLEL